MKNLILFLLLVFFQISCNSRKSEEIYTNHSTNLELADASAVSISSPTTSPLLSANRTKIVRNATISYKVSNIEKEQKFINQTVLKLGGHIESSSQKKSSSSDLVVRIPSAKFDTLVLVLNNEFGKPVNIEIRSQDFSDQYSDKVGYLKSRKALETRYLELLNKANSIEDMIALEEKLNQVRTEIEMYQAELNRIDNNVNFSTFYIHLSENGSLFFADDSFFSNAFLYGWRLVQNTLFALMAIWPVYILLLILYVVYKRYKKI